MRCALAAILAASAAAKLRSPSESAAALSTFGVRPRARVRLLVFVALTEAALAVGTAVGLDAAAYAAAALLSVFAVALALALRAGRAGAPCACFGARSRVRPWAVVRAAALAVAFAAVPQLPETELGKTGWLAVGLGVSLAGCAALGVAVLALAREVGELRLRLPAEGALELADEGPALGERTAIGELFARGPRTQIALAVFTSQGCHLCRALEPVVAAFAKDPIVALGVFDDVRHADVWRALRIPGSPFAVALDLDGTVRAKGTFNSFGQLESILAAAERRSVEEARV